MPDEDIMEQLKGIDEDEIVGQEVSSDDEIDLDFEGLGEADDNSAPSPLVPNSTTIAPPAPRAEAKPDAEVKPDVKDESATKKSSKPKSSKPKATTKSVREIPAQGTSVTDTEELVVRAKILRIVADKIIIEPGVNISFSR